MTLNTIHHIAIICSDKDAALHFYHDLLGFPIIRSNYSESLLIGDAGCSGFQNYP